VHTPARKFSISLGRGDYTIRTSSPVYLVSLYPRPPVLTVFVWKRPNSSKKLMFTIGTAVLRQGVHVSQAVSIQIGFMIAANHQQPLTNLLLTGRMIFRYIGIV
jgi:hypothetical protein